jgi:hypothetical protein
MAPKQPLRTPRIATGFDQSYRCKNEDCENHVLDVLDAKTQLDERTWTCEECGEPVLIEMTDGGGRTVYVYRCEAQDVVKSDMLYLDHDISHAYRVLESKKGEGKTNGSKWRLALEKYTALHLAPDQYVNRI